MYTYAILKLYKHNAKLQRTPPDSKDNGLSVGLRASISDVET